MSGLLINKDQLNVFYEKCSFAGLLTIYSMKLSFDKKLAFNRNDLTKSGFGASSDYFYAFAVACTSFGFFTYNFKNDVITVTSIEEIVSTSIESVVLKRTSTNAAFQPFVNHVKKYFG
jgi:hypothetical protein